MQDYYEPQDSISIQTRDYKGTFELSERRNRSYRLVSATYAYHTRHHQKHVDNCNSAIECTELEDAKPEELFQRTSLVTDVVLKRGGQVYNHSLFWSSFSLHRNNEPKGGLAESIDEHFCSFQNFITEFASAAGSQFGSGCAGLVGENDHLIIASTPNHINPLINNTELSKTILSWLE